MAAENALINVAKKVTYPLRFHNLNSSCMRLSSHIDIYEPVEDDFGFCVENSMTYVFVNFRPPYLCPSDGHKHGVSIRSLINLSKTFLRISPARNIAQTWIFATLFDYSSSFSSLILDFVCWMVSIVVWQWKPALENEAGAQRDMQLETLFKYFGSVSERKVKLRTSWLFRKLPLFLSN